MDEIRKKRRWFILIPLALAIVGILFVVLSSMDSSNGKYKKLLAEGDHYLLELDYEKAIVAYKMALDIDPANTSVAMKVAEAYKGLIGQKLAAGEDEAAGMLLEEAVVMIQEVQASVGGEDPALDAGISELRQLWVDARPTPTPTPSPTPTPKPTPSPTPTPAKPDPITSLDGLKKIRIENGIIKIWDYDLGYGDDCWWYYHSDEDEGWWVYHEVSGTAYVPEGVYLYTMDIGMSSVDYVPSDSDTLSRLNWFQNQAFKRDEYSFSMSDGSGITIDDSFWELNKDDMEYDWLWPENDFHAYYDMEREIDTYALYVGVEFLDDTRFKVVAYGWGHFDVQ